VRRQVCFDVGVFLMEDGHLSLLPPDHIEDGLRLSNQCLACREWLS